MTMNVNLIPRLENMIKQKVASGLYSSASDVVREAVRLVEAEDRLRDVEQGVRDGLDSGEPTPWNPEEIKQAGRRRRAARMNAGQKA